MSDVVAIDRAQSSLGLDLTGDLPFEEWVELGRKLRQAVDRAGWWIGDWINYGEVTYGSKYELALDVTGLSYGTLRNFASVAQRFELSRRRDNLSFQHHAAVASLDRGAQDRWLDMAASEELSMHELRNRLQLERGTPVREEVQRVSIDAPPDRAQRWRDAAERAEMGFAEWAAGVLDQASA